jgi:hypothetical protein
MYRVHTNCQVFPKLAASTKLFKLLNFETRKISQMSRSIPHPTSEQLFRNGFEFRISNWESSLLRPIGIRNYEVRVRQNLTDESTSLSHTLVVEPVEPQIAAALNSELDRSQQSGQFVVKIPRVELVRGDDTSNRLDALRRGLSNEYDIWKRVRGVKDIERCVAAVIDIGNAEGLPEEMRGLAGIVMRPKNWTDS